MHDFLDRYKRLNDYKPTAAEAIANVERFKKFGSKMTMKALGEKYNMTLEQVFEMKAGIAYETLLMDFEQEMYRKDLEAAHQMLAKKK